MKTPTLAIMLALCSCHAAEDEQVTAAKAAILDMLNDPSSAQWKDVDRSGPCVRGFINAKNSFGGYVGYRPFYYNISIKEAGLSPGDPSNAELSLGLKDRFEGQKDYLSGETRCLDASTKVLQDEVRAIRGGAKERS